MPTSGPSGTDPGRHSGERVVQRFRRAGEIDERLRPFLVQEGREVVASRHAAAVLDVRLVLKSRGQHRADFAAVSRDGDLD